VATEREDPRSVALVGDLERDLVAQAQLLHESVVASEREQAARTERPGDRRGLERYRTHVVDGLFSLSAVGGMLMLLQRDLWPKVRVKLSNLSRL
jgi:hypothetical protein